MAEIQEMVDMKSLKEQFPDVSDEILTEVAEQEGLRILEEKHEEEETSEEPIEEAREDSQEVVEEVKPDNEKKVPLKALQEEREKRQKVSAQLLALQAELEKVRAVVPQTTQNVQTIPAQSTQAQPQPVNSESQYFAQLTELADREVRQQLGITEEDVSTLQFTDQRKWMQYNAQVNAKVMERHEQNKQQYSVVQRNQQFAQELVSDPLFQPVYKFFKQEMDDMPVREAKAILDAEQRISYNQGSPEDIALLRSKYTEYKNRFISLTNANPATPNNVVPTVATVQGADKATQAAQHPRTGMLGGGSSQSMSTAEIERYISEGRGDLIPADYLAKVLRG